MAAGCHSRTADMAVSASLAARTSYSRLTNRLVIQSASAESLSTTSTRDLISLPFRLFKHADRFNRLVAMRLRVPHHCAVAGQILEFRRVNLAAASSDANRDGKRELHGSSRRDQRQHP